MNGGGWRAEVEVEAETEVEMDLQVPVNGPFGVHTRSRLEIMICRRWKGKEFE